MPESLRDYLEFAVETAYQAGRMTLAYYQTGVHADTRPDGSPVTVADRRTEEFIRSRLEKRYPLHAITGEEHGRTGSNGATHCWYIDPIDGTLGFVQGTPFYSVLIGLEIEGQTQVGAAYFPALDEMVAGASGEGCWWNGRRAHVSEVATLEQAVGVFTEVKEFQHRGYAEQLQRVIQATRFCAGWGFAYGQILVATGRAELALEPYMDPWDRAPFVPILQEAGGYCGDWFGNRTIHSREGLATTNLLLPQILPLLQIGTPSRPDGNGTGTGSVRYFIPPRRD